MLIMDNASFHRIARIKQICHEAGVMIAYLPPYSMELNSIKEIFAELKLFIQKHQCNYKDHLEQCFDLFLEWCLNMVRAKNASAQDLQPKES